MHNEQIVQEAGQKLLSHLDPARSAENENSLVAELVESLRRGALTDPMEKYVDGLSEEDLERFRDRLRDLVVDLKARAALMGKG